MGSDLVRQADTSCTTRTSVVSHGALHDSHKPLDLFLGLHPPILYIVSWRCRLDIAQWAGLMCTHCTCCLCASCEYRTSNIYLQTITDDLDFLLTSAIWSALSSNGLCRKSSKSESPKSKWEDSTVLRRLFPGAVAWIGRQGRQRKFKFIQSKKRVQRAPGVACGDQHTSPPAFG
jgi:hypothetical protein